MGTSVRAGAIAGVVGCIVFLVLHAAWIVPIWFVAPVGLVLAAAGGSVLGRFIEVLAGSRAGSVGRSALALLVAGLLLAPAILVAEMGLRVGAASGLLVAAGFFGPMLGIGACLGWLVARTRHAAGMGLLAGLLIAVGPGHNIPYLAHTPAVPMELTILASALAAASLAFGIAGRVLMRASRSPRTPPQSVGEPTR